jgi:sec-independent protein translocase protein TatA
VFNVGPTELLLILVLALIVFGPNKLPEVSRSIGRGLREFRRASDEIQGQIQGALNLDGDGHDEPEASTEPSTTEIPETPSGHTGASGNGQPQGEPDPTRGSAD